MLQRSNDNVLNSEKKRKPLRSKACKWKIAASVLLKWWKGNPSGSIACTRKQEKLFINRNERCHTNDALLNFQMLTTYNLWSQRTRNNTLNCDLGSFNLLSEKFWFNCKKTYIDSRKQLYVRDNYNNKINNNILKDLLIHSNKLDWFSQKALRYESIIVHHCSTAYLHIAFHGCTMSPWLSNVMSNGLPWMFLNYTD